MSTSGGAAKMDVMNDSGAYTYIKNGNIPRFEPNPTVKIGEQAANDLEIHDEEMSMSAEGTTKPFVIEVAKLRAEAQEAVHYIRALYDPGALNTMPLLSLSAVVYAADIIDRILAITRKGPKNFDEDLLLTQLLFGNVANRSAFMKSRMRAQAKGRNV